ncbi:MAG: hypothetical protein E7Z95_07525 [Actinomyces succiniciruminis]|nr:hypothetical protein [Actinomyces succiniciruminis]
MNRRLFSGLLRIGTSLRHSESRLLARTQTVALFLGTCLLCLSLAGLALTWFGDALHRDRAESIAPQLCNAQEATVLYRFGGFTQVNNRPVTVIVLSPLSDDAPLPPGVDQWPEPGEAVVSPALARDLTGQLEGLFGPVSAEIGLDGLEVPQERRVYLRPTEQALNADGMEPICGFGAVVEGGAYAGSGSLNASPVAEVLLLVAGVLLLPALGATASASSLRGEENRRRITALVTSGLRRRDLAVIDLAETWPGILGGFVLAGALTGVAMYVDVRVPWVDAWFPAADTRRLAGPIVAALLIGAVLAVAIVLLGRGRGRHVAAPRRHHRRWKKASPSLLLICGLLLAIWFPLWNPSSVFKQFAYAIGVVLTVLALPGVVTALSAWCGRMLARWGYRRSHAGRLIAGRQLVSLSEASSHLALAMTLALLAGGQIQLWASSMSPQYFESVETLDRWGEKVAVLDHLDAAAASEDLVALLPNEVGAFSAGFDFDESDAADAEPVPHIEAGCELLSSWGLDCAEQQVSATELLTDVPVLGQVYELAGATDIEITPTADPAQIMRGYETGSTVYLMSVYGADLDMRGIERMLHANAPGVQIITQPQEWITAGQVQYIRARWTVTLGAVGMSVLAIVLGLALAHDSARAARNLAPVGALSGSVSCAASTARWRTGVIVLVSGLTATVLYRVLPIGMARISTDNDIATWQPSTAYIAVCLAITVLVAAVASISAARATGRATRRWRP